MTVFLLGFLFGLVALRATQIAAAHHRLARQAHAENVNELTARE